MTDISIIDKLKRSKILDLLQEGKRIDDRALDEPRPLVIDTGVIPHANGSARVRSVSYTHLTLPTIYSV